MIRLFLIATAALSVVVSMLWGSWWLFEKEVMEFLGVVWAAIRYLGTQLSKLTFAGITKYISAQAARFFTFELWKTLLIRWIRQSIVPIIITTAFGEWIVSGLARLGWMLRKWRIMTKRRFRQQHPFIQVVLWIVSAILTVVITINLIGIGVLAFAFTLPAWVVGFLRTGIVKLWIIIQRAIFKSIMFAISQVGGKQLAKRIGDKHLVRLDRARIALDEKKLRVKETAKEKLKRIWKKVKRPSNGVEQDVIEEIAEK